jgi:hypothetical protein
MHIGLLHIAVLIPTLAFGALVFGVPAAISLILGVSGLLHQSPT